MPRTSRIVVPDQPHHIVLRGNNRRRLFSYEPDYRLFLRYLEDALERAACVLHAICMMTNHVHMQVTPHLKEALAQFVKLLSQRYALVRNRKRKSSGKLFEQRYFSVPILGELPMATTTVYIEVNAWRAGMVRNPMDYRWSSYAISAGRPQRSAIPLHLITPSAWYQELGSTAQERADVYRDFSGRLCMSGRNPSHASSLDARKQRLYDGRNLSVRRPDGSYAR